MVADINESYGMFKTYLIIENIILFTSLKMLQSDEVLRYRDHDTLRCQDDVS